MIADKLDFSQNVFINLDEHPRLKLKYDSIKKLYELYEMLGEGSFSKVYRAKYIPTGEIIAVKVSIIHPFLI